MTVPELQGQAYRILEKDPGAAIRFVEALPAEAIETLDEVDLAGLRASVYVDAGSDLRDPQIIHNGVLLFTELCDRRPERLDYRYNLANGYSALAQTMTAEGGAWYSVTSQPRRWARYRFADVASASPDRGLRARALTNQANLLAQSFRWVEALEAYRAAVQADSANAVASSGAAKILIRARRRGLGDPEALGRLARRYVELAEAHLPGSRSYSARANDLMSGLPSSSELPESTSETARLTGYAKWVADERLPLSLAVEGLGQNVDRWDSLGIGKLIEPLDTGDGVPPTFAALNVLKSDYLSARWVCYTALHEAPKETGLYTDTLDYAVYGVEQSLLVLSQKAAFDLLDKIAVATAEYLDLGQSPSSIYFRSFWHRKRKSPTDDPVWKPRVQSEIESGARALIALSEMAEDIQHGGYLNERRQLRHAGTHRLVVLHDMSSTPSRSSRVLHHEDEAEFAAETIETLRTVRAALLYLIEFIAYREAKKEQSAEGMLGTLIAPSHEWVRGEDI